MNDLRLAPHTRNDEIAIRMALRMSRHDVTKLVLRSAVQQAGNVIRSIGAARIRGAGGPLHSGAAGDSG